MTTGDLISELYVNVSSGDRQARIGGELQIESGDSATINIRFLDPDSLNHNNDNPEVRRVDLIVGEIHGHADDPDTDSHSHTRVAARIESTDWVTEGDYKVMQYRLENISSDHYVRVRGTNGNELEPALDPRGEDPWSDLWFYSNPVRILVQ